MYKYLLFGLFFFHSSFFSSLDHVSQLSPRESCSREELQEKWTELQLPMEQLETLLSLGNFGPEINWMAFFAHSCTALGGVRNRADATKLVINAVKGFYHRREVKLCCEGILS